MHTVYFTNEMIKKKLHEISLKSNNLSSSSAERAILINFSLMLFLLKNFKYVSMLILVKNSLLPLISQLVDTKSPEMLGCTSVEKCSSSHV